MQSHAISPAFAGSKRRCCLTLSLGICEQKSIHSNRETITNKILDTTIVQLGETMSLIGITYSNMGEEFLTGAAITQRELCHPSMNDK